MKTGTSVSAQDVCTRRKPKGRFHATCRRQFSQKSSIQRPGVGHGGSFLNLIERRTLAYPPSPIAKDDTKPIVNVINPPNTAKMKSGIEAARQSECEATARA